MLNIPLCVIKYMYNYLTYNDRCNFRGVCMRFAKISNNQPISYWINRGDPIINTIKNKYYYRLLLLKYKKDYKLPYPIKIFKYHERWLFRAGKIISDIFAAEYKLRKTIRAAIIKRALHEIPPATISSQLHYTYKTIARYGDESTYLYFINNFNYMPSKFNVHITAELYDNYALMNMPKSETVEDFIDFAYTEKYSEEHYRAFMLYEDAILLAAKYTTCAKFVMDSIVKHHRICKFANIKILPELIKRGLKVEFYPKTKDPKKFAILFAAYKRNLTSIKKEFILASDNIILNIICIIAIIISIVNKFYEFQ